MKAMIFAAGLGTRLRPWTELHPKALVPVGGVPMLQRVMLKLRALGIDEMVVNVHHYADQVVDFLRANDDFGCTVHISDETPLLLDTGGGILAARRWLEPGGEPFVVHNADILTDAPIDAMIRAHTGDGADATLLVAERRTSRYLLIDHGDRMRGWTDTRTGRIRPAALAAALEHSRQIPKDLENSRKFSKILENSRAISSISDPPRKFSRLLENSRDFSKDFGELDLLAFGGVHVMSPTVFASLADYRPEGQPFSIMDWYIDSCSTLDIRGWMSPTPYMWHDIGKPEALAAAEAALK